jgi:hypothetical protein
VPGDPRNGIPARYAHTHPPNPCHAILTPLNPPKQVSHQPSTPQPRRTTLHPPLRQRATARWVDCGRYDPITALDSVRTPGQTTTHLQPHERLLVGWIAGGTAPTMTAHPTTATSHLLAGWNGGCYGRTGYSRGGSPTPTSNQDHSSKAHDDNGQYTTRLQPHEQLLVG